MVKMDSFSLYDRLESSRLIKAELNWEQVCSTLGNFPVDHGNVITTLIIYYHLKILQKIGDHSNSETKYSEINLSLDPQLERSLVKKKKTSVIKLPYGGHSLHGGKGVIFNIRNIPKDLQTIIYKYVHYVINPAFVQFV